MHWKKMDEAYRASNIDELLDLCKKVLAQDPQNLHARYYHALGNRKKGNLLESVSAMDQIVRENPQEADFWAERGVTYLHLNNKEKALEDFNMALTLNPDNAYRYSSRAFARAHFKDIDGAIKDYQKALEIDPEDIASLNNLGLLEEQQGRKSAAKTLYEKADNAAGVKYTDPSKLKEIAKEHQEQQEQQAPVETQTDQKLTFSFYLKTARETLFTKKGREEFLSFFRDKLKKKQ